MFMMGARGAEMTYGSSHPPHFEGAFRGLVVVGPIGSAITRPRMHPTDPLPTDRTAWRDGREVRGEVLGMAVAMSVQAWLELALSSPSHPTHWESLGPMSDTGLSIMNQACLFVWRGGAGWPQRERGALTAQRPQGA